MRILITLISLLILSCGASKNDSNNYSGTQNSETEGSNSSELQIRECFSGYKSAILNDKGSQAINLVDSRTIKYYSDILAKTISADSTGINNLNAMDKITILTIRHQASKEAILSFDGKKLLEYAIKKGMVSKNSVVNTKIGEVIIDGLFAKGQLISNGNNTPVYFHFYNEDNNWKIDLTSIFPIANQAFKKMLNETEEGENEYLFNLLEMITGIKPDKNIWKPIK